MCEVTLLADKAFHELQDYSDSENFQLVTLCYGYICSITPKKYLYLRLKQR